MEHIPPAHPIDRSRLVRYVTSRRVRLAVCAALSSKVNPRNLEVEWYPAYNNALSDLVDFEFEGALTVAQQYNLWLSKATFDLYKVPQDALDAAAQYWFSDDDDDDDHEEDNSVVEGLLQLEGEEADKEEEQNELDFDPAVSSSPPRVPGRPRRDRKRPANNVEDYLTSAEARAALHPNRELTQEEIQRALDHLQFRARLVNNPSDATDADTSMETLRTVPDGQAKDQFPDMILCHSYAVEVPMPDNPEAVFSWERRARCKIRHQCFPLIMEIKGCPSRALRGGKLETRKQELLESAAAELYGYVCAYFTRDVCAKSVIAVIASGLYWQWTQVKRDEVVSGKIPGRAGPVLPTKSYKFRSAFVSRLESAPIFELATDASDTELTRLRDDFLIPLVEEHHRYPFTMAPNPQPPSPSPSSSSSPSPSPSRD